MFGFPKPTVPASLEATKAAIDAVAKASGFRCVPVSWEDAQRTNGGFGGLSSGGPNIADVRLYEKTGRLLYTLRSENWNERLGYVSSHDVTLITGNEVHGNAVQHPITLAKYLQTIGQHAGYVGVVSPSLFEQGVDEIFTIRFQSVFLPVEQKTGARSTTEFCTEVYSYNTTTDDDPRNMLLLATPQGTSVQQDGRQAQRLYYHSVSDRGTVERYWLEAEQSAHRVGGQQQESLGEALEAASRGKAVAVQMGPSAMGTRFNVQMLIQVPLKQAPRAPPRVVGGGRGGFRGGFGGAFGSPAMSACAPSPCFNSYGNPEMIANCEDDADGFVACSKPSMAFSTSSSTAEAKQRRASVASPAIGTSNAARVSRGSLQDTYRGVAKKNAVREPSMHGTITVTLYYTVAGGVPSADDVKRCVADLDALYKSMPSDKRLVQCTEVTYDPSKPKSLPGFPVAVAPAIATHPSPTGILCPNRHTLSSHVPGLAPVGGYNCDSCGLYSDANPANASYGCRACDYDVCQNCHSKGPRCEHGVVMGPVAAIQGVQYRVCHGCSKNFASHVGTLYGCPCTTSSNRKLFCVQCYLQKVMAMKLMS